MRKCKTCKHWYYEPEWDDFGACIKIGDKLDRTKLTLAEVQGDFNVGMLATKAEFGCVLWEAKDEEAA